MSILYVEVSGSANGCMEDPLRSTRKRDFCEIFEGTKGGYKPLTAESRPTSVKLEDRGEEARHRMKMMASQFAELVCCLLCYLP